MSTSRSGSFCCICLLLAAFVLATTGGLQADLMHAVRVNDQFFKLTQAKTLQKIGVKLFDQSTASSLFFLEDSLHANLSMAFFVADQKWGRMIYAERYGNWTKAIGRDNLPHPDADLGLPMGVACDNALDANQCCHVFVADYTGGGVKEFAYSYQTETMTFIKSLWSLPRGSEPDVGAWEVAVHDNGTPSMISDDHVWAIDNYANRIVKYEPFNPDGGRGVRYSYGSEGSGEGQFGLMTDLVWGRDPLSDVGSNNQYLYVADDENQRIVVLWLQGDGTFYWYRTYALPEGFWCTALEVDGFGHVYAADYQQSVILKFSGGLWLVCPRFR